MNILIVGSGGREHALAWKISQSPLCSQLFIAPGNAGTLQHGRNVEINVNDFKSLKKLCIKEDISLVVVGPEDPLVNGIYDYLNNNEASSSGDVWSGIVIGPSAAGAQLEGSKSFSKHFMQKQNIPTAAYAEFDANTYEEGRTYLSQHTLPIVLKADGLAAGKGVIICNTHDEALKAFEEMLINKQFGSASSKVVVEEFLQGIEVSVFVLTDGVDYKIIGHAKDYKRIGEGDTGLNTGGMGCVTPVPFVDDVFMKKVEERIIQPTIKGLQTEHLEYKGFVFIGLMNVDGEPYVIEYNCRLGDPETEVILPRLKNDLVELLMAMHEDNLNNITIEYDERLVCTVMAVSGGYPGLYSKNKLISLQVDKLNSSTSMIFHAGTKAEGNNIVTNGGRVLAVTSFGNSISEAVDKSISSLQCVSFDGMYYRKDIGFEFT